MNGANLPKEEKDLKHHKTKVHHTLAHSYYSYFILFLIGLSFDLFFPIKISIHPAITLGVGLIIIILSTFLIFWAQRTSHKLDIKNEITVETFCKGPYCYTRTPTNFGLFFLVLGFALVINAFFLIIATVVSFVFAKLIFLKQQEDILVEKYGAPYIEYKKKVKF